MTIKFNTIITFLLVSISASYSTSWDDIDASLSSSKCKILKEKIKYRTFYLEKEYNHTSGGGARSNIDYSIKISGTIII